MNTDLFNTVNKQQQQFVASVQQFNQLAVANVEKLFALQFKTLYHYSDLSFKQLKALVEVRTPQQLQDYVQQQGEVAQRFGETLAEDTRAVAELGAEYQQQAQELARESVETVTELGAEYQQQAQELARESTEAVAEPVVEPKEKAEPKAPKQSA